MLLAIAQVGAEGEHRLDRRRLPLDAHGDVADGEADGRGGLVDPHLRPPHERASGVAEDAFGDVLGEGLDEVVGAAEDLLVDGVGDLGVVDGARERIGTAGRGGGQVQRHVDHELADPLLLGEHAVMAPGADPGDLDAVQSRRAHRRTLRRSRSPTRTAGSVDSTSCTRTAQAPCSAL